MDEYSYRKTVRAAIIKELVWGGDGKKAWPIAFIVENGELYEIPSDILTRDPPGRGIGDYLVQYQTGCLTVVPKIVFEDGFQKTGGKVYTGDGDTGKIK